MSQIEITVLKEGNRYKNVLSVSFFTMKNSYRPIEFYQQKLKTFIQRKNALVGFETRIYTDNSGKDIALQVADENTTVLQYNCEPFREGDGHTGTFGTIVRFLPLFEKDLDTVWISDIDIDKNFLSPELYNTIQKKKLDVFIDTIVCYDRKPWIDVDNKYPIIAHRFISKIRFPKQIFTNFLKRLIDGKYSDLIDNINLYNKRKTPNNIFPYGMDEAFLNGPIYNNLKKHDANVIIRKDYYIIQGFLRYSIQNFPSKDADILERYYRNTEDMNLFKKTKDIIRKYGPMILDKHPCFQELLDELNSFKNSFVKMFLLRSSDL